MHARLTVEVLDHVFIPMRDGTELCARLTKPKKPGRYPGVLIRTPYGRFADEHYATHGYAVCCVDARGTGASSGEYDYYNIRAGRYDGHDLVEWLAAQEFCTGAVGTCGGSALGAYQLLTAATRPPHLRAMAVDVAMLDFYDDQWYPGGVLRLENRLGWVAGTERRAAVAALDGEKPADAATAAKLGALRRARLAREATVRRAVSPDPNWAQPYFTAPVRTSVWDEIDLTPRLDAAEVPILHSGVLFDHFGPGTLKAYRRQAGRLKHLVMRPGSLGFAGPTGDHPLAEMNLAWFDHHLKGQPLRFTSGEWHYCTGTEEWLVDETSAPAGARTWQLTAAGGLTADSPGPAETVELKHDPTAPVVSEANLTDFGPFVAQPGVALFATAPLPEPLMVRGRPRLRLAVRTEMPDANLLVRFLADTGDGRWRQLNFGARRLALRDSLAELKPAPRGETVTAELEIWPVCHTFTPGTRLGLAVSLSDFPFFENSPHAGTLAVLTGGASRLDLQP